MHPAPACPPRVGGAQSLDQHRAGPTLDSYPCFPMQGSEREARGQECVRTRLLELRRIPERGIGSFEIEYLRRIRLILPLDNG